MVKNVKEAEELLQELLRAVERAEKFLGEGVYIDSLTLSPSVYEGEVRLFPVEARLILNPHGEFYLTVGGENYKWDPVKGWVPV